MISLVCGTALSEGRTRLLSTFDPANTVCITADSLRESALAMEAFPNPVRVKTAATIFDNLLAGSSAKILPERFYRSLVRQVLESSPRKYDRLFGNQSAPRLTDGVLSYILSALNLNDEFDALENPRATQLRLLQQSVEQILTESGFIREAIGLKQMLAALSTETLSLYFPGVSTFIFVDFPQYNDSLYLLMGAANRAGLNCWILMDYHPGEEIYPGGPLDSAYMVLYEMADRLYFNEEDLGDLLSLESFSQQDTAIPYIVDIPNVFAEIEAAVLLIQKVLEDDSSGQVSIVLGIPQSDLYQVWLKEKLGTISDQCQWLTERPVSRGHLWQYLLKLAACSSNRFTVTDLAQLVRSRYFSIRIPGHSPWDFASKLELLLNAETEFRSIADLQDSLASYFSDKSKYALLQRAEVESLGEFLKQLEAFVQTFREKHLPSAWGQILLNYCEKLENGDQSKSDDLRFVCDTLYEFENLWPLLSPENIRLDRFLRLLKSSFVSHAFMHQSSLAPVTICDYNTASAFRSDLCLLLGCNDGNFPRFGKQEAVFLSEPNSAILNASMARQFDIIGQCKSRSRRLLLFVPAHEGTEELLESQFIEPLMASGAIRFSLNDLMQSYQLPTELPKNRLDELAFCLRDVELNETDQKRFQNGPARVTAHSIFVTAQRSANHLTAYDGYITDSALAAWLRDWSNGHIYSISQLDKSIGCSFRFFTERIMNLNDESAFDELISSSFYGSFVHDTLAYFYREWVEENKFIILPNQEWEAREHLVSTYYKHLKSVDILSPFAADLLEYKMFGELGADGFAKSEKALIELEDPGALGIFLMMEIARAVEPEVDAMIPSNFEVGFGLGIQEHDDELTRQEFVELALPHSESIKLRGRIDRIDVSSSGKFVVTDYKTGILPQKRQLLEGFKTQLPIYTLVAEELLKARFDNPESAGGLYYSMKRAERNKVNGMFLRSQYKKSLGVTGTACLSDEDYYAVLDRVRHIMSRSIKDIREGRLTHTPYDSDVVCPFCPLEKMCYRNVDRMADLLTASPTEDSQ